MKKILLGFLLILIGGLAFVQSYLPRTVDATLIGLMLDNVEQLIASKGDRVAEVAVDTLYDRLDWELDARKRYIMGEVIDRLSIEYGIAARINEDKDGETDDTTTKDTIIDKGVVVDTDSQPAVGGKHQLGTTTYVQPIEPAPTPTTMQITTYWHKAGAACDSFVQEVKEVTRSAKYLQTTLEYLLQGPGEETSAGLNGLSEDDLSSYLNTVAIVDGVAFVDFNNGFFDNLIVCEGTISHPLNLLNTTVLGVKGVEHVIYALEGNVSNFYVSMNGDTGFDVSLDDLQSSFDNKKFITQQARVLASRGRRLYSSAYGLYEEGLDDGELTNYRVCGHGHGECLSVIERDSAHRIEKSGCEVVHYRMDRAICGDEYITMLGDRQLVVSDVNGRDEFAITEFMQSIAVK